MERRNIRLLIAYDGTNYQGWQRQKEAPTIQGTIEGVLTKITREAITLTGAGRTDSGVHAWGQVANFSTSSPLPIEKFQQALNALLPEDVMIRKVSQAAEGFHARFSSRAKVYDYLIWNTPGLLFFRPYVCFIREGLDLERMAAGLSRLIGERDFSSFQSQGSQVSHPVRELYQAGLWRHRFGWIRLRFKANGFLRHMVRNMAGTLIRLGLGRISLQEFEEIVKAGERSRAGEMAPARGLYLRKVFY